MKTPMEGLSIVIPVYNSAASLGTLVEALDAVLRNFATQSELILVDDGSHDASWATICALAAKHDWVRGVNLMRNVGQQNALLCGVRAARYDVIATMDDDLQHPPSELPKILERLSEGWDVVYGTPDHDQHGFLRKLATRLTKLTLGSAMGASVALQVSAFRAFRTELREAFAGYRGPFPSVDVLLTWGTTKFTAVEVRHDARRQGVSQYTFRKLLTHALNLTTSFSVVPLQFASLIGFGFTVFGFGVLMYVVGFYIIHGGSVPGFPFLASIIALFSGAQLFALGIIGEYLARMHFSMMERPTYVIRNTTEMSGSGEIDRRS